MPKTPRISLWKWLLTAGSIRKKSHEFRTVFIYKLSSICFFPNFLNLTILASRNFLRSQLFQIQYLWLGTELVHKQLQCRPLKRNSFLHHIIKYKLPSANKVIMQEASQILQI